MERDPPRQLINETIQVLEPAPRLDKYLALLHPGTSRAVAQKLIQEGFISVNGQKAKSSQKLEKGDTIFIKLPPPETSIILAEEIPLDIIYEDNDIIVLNKAAGLTVHPAPGHTSHTLVNALLARFPELVNFGASSRPGIVHRLDKDTSGLMIIAKNSLAQQNLIKQFKTHSISKGYLALVQGKVVPSRGIIEAPIGRHPANRKRMAIVSKGREAKTIYKVKEYIGNNTLLEIKIETGRTHQIRVHLSAIGHPIIGDITYGVRSAILKRQFLHAFRLGFQLPSTGEYKEFISELPSDLRVALDLIKS